MLICENVTIHCHVELDTTVQPDPGLQDMIRILPRLMDEKTEAIYAARQSTRAVRRDATIDEFAVIIIAEFVYDEGRDEGALEWEYDDARDAGEVKIAVCQTVPLAIQAPMESQ